ncbi:unnamed protein product [Vicia faba]|nr:unnamed protein product [Vicia faba]
MILGALAAMAQTKVKRPLAHSSIGHVGYIRTGFSCGTIEGIQSLLIGIFIYALMTIDAFAIVLALRQTRVKYIADLGALAKTNPISAITFSITMFSYVGIPPLAGFCSKFYLFFAYGKSNFYPLSDGPSTRHRRITKADFRPCSTGGSCSQAPFCLCTQGPISVWPEETFARLRYLLGGLRPIETVYLRLSLGLSWDKVRILALPEWYLTDGSSPPGRGPSLPST